MMKFLLWKIGVLTLTINCLHAEPAEQTKEVAMDGKGYSCYLAVNKITGVDYATTSFQKCVLYAWINPRTETTERTLGEALSKKRITLNYKLEQPSLVSCSEIKIFRVSSDEPRYVQQASETIDGDLHTLWHAKYAINEVPERPHELVVDLGKARMVKGFIYLPRQFGDSGQFSSTEFYLSEDPEKFKETPALRATISPDKVPQEFKMKKPVQARFLLVNIHSILNDHPHASSVESGVIERQSNPVNSEGNNLG